MKKEDLILFLETVNHDPDFLPHGNGFLWFKEELLPAIWETEVRLKDHPTLLAESWYQIADIHNLNDAPLKAIESYQKAIKYKPDFAPAYQEMASMQENIGEYEEALKNIKKAIEFDPNNENIEADLFSIQHSLSENSDPLYIQGNLNWVMTELLADQRFDEVIIRLKNTKEIDELKYLAAAYGAQGQNKSYLATWKKIEKTEGEIQLEYLDWFYLPDQIYQTPEIWRIFLNLKHRIIPSVFIGHDSLNKNYSDILTIEDRRALMCDYQIYTNLKDAKALARLGEKFPDWEEVQI